MRLVVDGVNVTVRGGRVRAAGPAAATWEEDTLTIRPAPEPDLRTVRLEMRMAGGISMTTTGTAPDSIAAEEGMELRLNGVDMIAYLRERDLLPCRLNVRQGKLWVGARQLSLAEVDEEVRGELTEVEATDTRLRLIDRLTGTRMEAGLRAVVTVEQADCLVLRASDDARINVHRVNKLVATTEGTAAVQCLRAVKLARLRADGGRMMVKVSPAAKIQRTEAGGTAFVHRLQR